MAEVVSSAIGLLFPLIQAEVSLISGLRGEVAAILNELSIIKPFLQNAEERADEDDSVKEWVRQVRTLAHEIEDVIEEYNLLSKGNEFFDKVKKIVPLNKRTIAKTIESLRKKAVDIGQRKTNYRFESVQQAGHFCNFEGSTHQLTILSVGMTEESELVGAETVKADLIGLLDLQEFEDSRISTIAVTGMRGLGKTTVVDSVYNDELVRDYFPIRAWIPASQPYSHFGILRSMYKQFYESHSQIKQFGESSCYDSDATNSTNYPVPERINSMDERTLLCRLKKFLSEMRYLVVFDDVQDGDLADYIKKALPFYDNKASKILITTRYENVARKWAEGSNQGLYKLKPLPSVEAWKLFCKTAFKNKEGNSCSFLDGQAQKIVKRCEGMPLIISEMGRFLSTKLDDLDEWKNKSESPGFCLRQDHPKIYKHLIRSSYHDLPHHLKPCFLYFGLFPEGCLIGLARIVRLWIAEGFIIVEGGNCGGSAIRTAEEHAEKYIKELVDMNLVEEFTDATGRSKNLRVPIILHETILSKITELGFCQTPSEKNNSTGTEEFIKPRRMSIHMDHSFHDADHQVMQNITKTKSSIRTLLYAKMHVQPAVSNLFSKNFLLLKVLDFSNALINNIPNEVGELLNLHYLCLRNTQVSRLPSSLGKLQYLQTLDLKQTLISELPADLNKLHKLRHLLTYCYKYDPAYSLHTQKLTGVKLPEKALEKCEELQKLAFVDVGHRSMVFKELRNMRQLRRLGITELKLEDGKDLCAAIEEMKCLQTFSVYSKNLSEIIDLDHFRSPDQLTLKRLYLNGPLKLCCTGWILELHSLVKIRLKWSCLENDPLPLFETLPNLVELQMLKAYNGENLTFVNGGFKKLKIVHLLDLCNLKSLSICKGALPLLQLMAIGESPSLQVPLGIKHLSKLETLNLFNMPLDFADSLRRNGKYHIIVKHVPNVLLQKSDDQGYWQASSLQ